VKTKPLYCAIFLAASLAIKRKVELDSTLCNAGCNKNFSRHVQEVLHYATSCANCLATPQQNWERSCKKFNMFSPFNRAWIFCVKMRSFPSTEEANWTVTRKLHMGAQHYLISVRFYQFYNSTNAFHLRTRLKNVSWRTRIKIHEITSQTLYFAPRLPHFEYGGFCREKISSVLLTP